MTERERQELLTELEAARLMVKDLERLWKSYAKKALVAKMEREEKADKKGFMDCYDEWELQELWAYGEMTEEDYHRGLAYFEEQSLTPIPRVIEKHRQTIKNLIQHWKGTILEFEQELNPTEKIKELSEFEKRELEERQERYKSMMWG